MKIFSPSKKYVSVSLTGSWCGLSCSFCRGRFLENMVHVTPESFVNTVHELYSSGVRGILLSGGFRLDGTLPVEPYLDGLREVKKRFNVVLSAHPGLIRDRELLARLKEVVDIVDYELTLSDYISREVRRLPFGPEVYVKALEYMVEEGLHVVPHVFVWHPMVSFEELAYELRLVEDLGLEEVTLLVFMSETPSSLRSTIAERVLELVKHVRLKFNGRVYMGCMRPGWLKPIIDSVLVEKELVDRLTNPHRKAVETCLKDHGFYDACCSVPENLLETFKEKDARQQNIYQQFK